MPKHELLHGLDSIIDNDSAILILGTFPGPESLKHHEYYKKVGNSFWRILFVLAEIPLVEDYDEKCSVLLHQKLALWDVYETVEREGAADKKIKNATTNNFRIFFSNYPHIKGLVFNGKGAEKAFKKAYPDIYAIKSHVTVWSTSGAWARKFEDKLENWRTAINVLSAPPEQPCP